MFLSSFSYGPTGSSFLAPLLRSASRDRAGWRRMQILSRCARPRMCDRRSLYAHTWSAGLAPDRRAVASEGVFRSTTVGADARVATRRCNCRPIWSWLGCTAASADGGPSTQRGMMLVVVAPTPARHLRLYHVRIFASLRSSEEAQQPALPPQPSPARQDPGFRSRGALLFLISTPSHTQRLRIAHCAVSSRLRLFARRGAGPRPAFPSPFRVATAHANCTIPLSAESRTDRCNAANLSFVGLVWG